MRADTRMPWCASIVMLVACGDDAGTARNDGGGGDGGGDDGGGGGLAGVVTTQPDILATSIALAADGSPRIVLRARRTAGVDEQDVLYAEPDGDGGWTVTPLAERPSSTFLSPELVVDANGTPHVLYDTAAGVYYARREGGSWTGTVVATPSSPAFALALGPSNSVHVAFRVMGAGGGVFHGAWNGAGFTSELVAAYARDVDLAVAGDGTIHVVTGNTYAFGMPGAYATEAIPNMPAIDRPSIALASGGQIELVAARSGMTGAQGIQRGRRDGGTWTLTEVTASGGINRTMIAVDDSDAVHFAAVIGGGATAIGLQYYKPNGGATMAVAVDGSPHRYFGDLVVSGAGTAHAAFAKQQMDVELRYVRP